MDTNSNAAIDCTADEGRIRFSRDFRQIYRWLISSIERDEQPIRFEKMIFDVPIDLGHIFRESRQKKRKKILYTFIETNEFADLPEESYQISLNRKANSNSIFFYELTFLKQLHFYNCRFETNIDIRVVTFNEYLSVEHSVFRDTVRVENSTFASGQQVEFINSTFHSQVTILGNTSFSGRVNFEETTFEEELKVTGTFFRQEVNFSGASFQKGAIFQKVEFDEVDFEQTEFCKKSTNQCNTYFGDVRFSKPALFKEAQFFGNTRFTLTVFEQGVAFVSTKFRGNVAFLSSTIQGGADFTGAKFFENAYFDASFSGKVSFTYVTFSGQTSFKGKILGPDGVTFDKSMISDKMEFSPKECQDVSFVESTITGMLILDLPEVFGTIDFKSSAIGNGSLKFNRRKIESDQLANFDTARLFKHTMTIENDGIHALHYKVCEMELYRKMGKIRLSDRVLLWFNYVSNNHGQCWARGGWFLFKVWVISFSIIAMAQYGLGSRFIWTDPMMLGRAIDYLWILDKTVSPFENPTWYVSILALVGKIFLGYGVFQIISAFRKHGKY